MPSNLTEQIIEFKRAGKTWNEIAAILGIKRECARSRWRHYLHQHPEAEQDGGETISFDEQLNTAKARTKSERIKTLEDLLEACEVDLEVWRVRKWGVKKWEGYAKRERVRLDYTAGRADGSIERGGIEVAPLWSVWADFVRWEPIPLFPIVQPVECKVEFSAPSQPNGEGIQRVLVWADPHFGFTRNARTAALMPFHDREALDVVLQIAQVVQPDRIDLLGDTLDLAEWSDRFIRLPEFQECTQPAILEAHWWLAQFRAACEGAQMRVFEGNHDIRMQHAIVKHLLAAHDLKAADEMELPPAMSVPKLLALHRLGIEWVGDYPAEEDWLNDGLRLVHGDTARGGPGDTAKAVVMAADATEIFGHIHRLEWVSRTKHARGGQEPLAAFCPGCVCHIDGRVPGRSSRQQWQQGCAIVDYETGGKRFSIYPVIIDAGHAIWDGNLFQARNRLRDLCRDVEGWNWRQ